MSILDAFKQVRDEDKSLDSLASLPQTLIMNMVQRKEIPQEHLPMIMAKKAEMAQTVANMKAAQAQQQQGQPGTIMEQLIAKNAAEEAARSAPAIEDQTQVGIASNPTQEMNFAGGGIVAFSGEEGSFVDIEKQQKEDQEALIETAKKLGVSLADVLTMVPRAGAGILNAGPIRGIRAAGVDMPYIPDVNGGDFSSMTPFYDKYIRKSEPAKPTAAAPAAPAAPKPDAQPPKPAAPTAANPNAQPPKPAVPPRAPEKDPYEELKELFKSQADDRAAARKDAKNMALLQTGLEILGGESPYAFANIGKGGARGAKAYQESMADIRKTEREQKRDYADIVSKQQDVGLRREDMGLKKEALDIQRQIANKPGEQFSIISSYAKSKGIPFDQAVEAVYGSKKTDPFMMMMMEQMTKGGGKLDRDALTKSLEKWQTNYGITPTGR